MAVYTDISEAELGAFLQGYDLGGLLSYKGIAEGVENTNYLLHTEHGSSFLTLFEKRVDADDLPFFVGLMSHLAGKGVICPQPVAKRDGVIIGELAGRPAIIVTFLEGMWPRRPTALHCRAVGAALATLHLAGCGFELTRKNALDIGGWRPLFNRCKDGAGAVDVQLGGEIEQELSDLENIWPSDLPQGVIHADLFPDNVFFLGENLSGIIDFYFACNDVLAYDIAICLNAWCFERDFSFNLTKGRALLAGYQSVRPLSTSEGAALPVLSRGAALRFLLTRLFDWINTPEGAVVTKKDPMEYARHLRFHRQVSDPGEYGYEPA